MKVLLSRRPRARYTWKSEIKERTPVATVACDYGYLDLDRQGKVIGSYNLAQDAHPDDNRR